MSTGNTWQLSLGIIVNFMWATQGPIIRMIGDKLGPITIAFVPLVTSTVLLLPFLWAENRRRSRRRTWKDLKYFIIPGLIGVFLMQYLYTLGSTLTLAANAGIITLTIPVIVAAFASIFLNRSEEHTSELQSRENLVCRLLLEKKKKINHIYSYTT